MMDPEEAYSNFLKNRRAHESTKLKELREGGKFELPAPDEKPDCIMAGPWPTTTLGALRHRCDRCGAYVSLGPKSGGAMHAKYPDVPVVCFACGVKAIQ